MSHRATTWLAGLAPRDLSNAEFRVLFHLCDCHNASGGCFPAQAYLMEMTGVSNGTLNTALNGLEARGLIQRHRSRDGQTHRQRPTHYTLGFEIEAPGGVAEGGAAAPVSGAGRLQPAGDGTAADRLRAAGDGEGVKPSPETGDGAVSRKRAKPSPISGQSRLQPTGEEPVSKPVRNLARAAGRRGTGAAAPVSGSAEGAGEEAEDEVARLWAGPVLAGRAFAGNAITDRIARRMVALGLVTEAQLRGVGVRL